jgi:hypothetical protein
LRGYAARFISTLPPTTKVKQMTGNDRMRIRKTVFAALAAGAVFLLMPGPPAQTAERNGGVLAQRQDDAVTPLRFLTAAEQRCQAACNQQAQQCYSRATTLSSRETCENFGITCQEDCLKPR